MDFKVHCTENPIYVFPEIKLRGIAPNSYIHVSVSDFYIPRIDLPILLVRHGLLNCKVHCTENPIFVFPEMKMRGLIPNSYIHVSVSDFYIPSIGLPTVFGCADSFPIPTFIYLWAIYTVYIPRIGYAYLVEAK